MFDIGLFGQSFKKLEKSLDLREFKHNLLLSNIANIETENYKPFDFIIEKEISKINENENNMDIKRTNIKHMDYGENKREKEFKYERRDYGDINFEEVINNDLENVMAELASNNINYNVNVKILAKKYNLMKMAINGGN